MAFNRKYDITPQTVKRAVQESLRLYETTAEKEGLLVAEGADNLDVAEVIRQLEQDMFEAADQLEFERAAMLRDQIATLRKEERGDAAPSPGGRRKKVRY